MSFVPFEVQKNGNSNDLLSSLFVTEEILYSITAVSDQGVDGWMTSLLLLLTAKAAVKVSSKTFYTVNWYSDFCLSE